jgi:hypothetical protein
MKGVYHLGMRKRTRLTAIQVVDYDPHWPRIFRQLRDQIWPSVSEVGLGKLVSARVIITKGDLNAGRDGPA